MDTQTQSPVLLYTEETPNPESLKFVTNRIIYQGTADFDTPELARDWSNLADRLFSLPFVKRVYICNNFVTITKEFTYAWPDIMLQVKELIKQVIQAGEEIVKEGFAEVQKELLAKQHELPTDEKDAEIALRIRDLIDTYVKPAVEMDGGNIEFRSYDKGKVTVILQGSCSGCPSSTVTLKSGIEGMLKRMVPEVTEVVSLAG